MAKLTAVFLIVGLACCVYGVTAQGNETAPSAANTTTVVSSPAASQNASLAINAVPAVPIPPETTTTNGVPVTVTTKSSDNPMTSTTEKPSAASQILLNILMFLTAVIVCFRV